MPVEIEGHTVAYFKAPIYAKLDIWGLEYGGTLSIQTSLLNIGCLLHEVGFVQREIATTERKICPSETNFWCEALYELLSQLAKELRKVKVESMFSI